MIKFIRTLKNDYRPTKVHVLLIWLGRDESDQEAFNRIAQECLLVDIVIDSDYKKSLGKSFLLIHRQHPNEEDIKACVEWTKNFDN